MMRVRLKFRRLIYTGTAVFLTFLMMFAIALPVSAAGKKVKLSETQMVLVQYSRKKLKLKRAKGKVKWKSGNKKVAAVSSGGRVRAKEPGTCQITAKNQGKVYVCMVTVEPLALSAATLTVKKGSTALLQLNNPDIQASWSSSDPKVATVDQTGKVTAVGSGSCVIRAVYKDSTLSCKLTVPSETVKKTGKDISLVLAGSSSMAMWSSAAAAFSPCRIINSAESGTLVVQWLNWVQERIVRHAPSAVVLYVGSNDLGDGAATDATGEKNAENTVELIKKIRVSLPATTIFYVGVNPCWARKNAWTAIEKSNMIMKQYCGTQANMYYIDIASYFKAPDGTPDQTLFADQLHPNAAGYAIWAQVVAGTVKRVMGVS